MKNIDRIDYRRLVKMAPNIFDISGYAPANSPPSIACLRTWAYFSPASSHSPCSGVRDGIVSRFSRGSK